MYIDVGGIRVNYSISGEGDNIVVLQGWGTTVELYSGLCVHLAKTHRVCVLDFPGAGGTEEPEKPMCADDYARFTLKFLAAVGIEEATLIGHSNGGRVAMKIVTGPDTGLKVPRMVLMGSAGIVHEPSPKQRRKTAAYKRARAFLSIKPIRALFPDAVENLKKKRGSEDYRNASPVMRETLVRLVNEDFRGLLPAIKQPTLLIWGENDTATPVSDGRLMEELIPNAGLVTVAGAGHYAYLEKPDFIYRVLDSFLGGAK